jgi:predicted DNA-binding WGR domain protein
VAEPLRKTVLHNTTAGHNKQYTVEIERQGDGYNVVVYWGKIDANPMSQRKASDVTYSTATLAMDELLLAKKKKGYREVSTKAAAIIDSTFAAPKAKAAPIPVKAAAVKPSEVIWGKKPEPEPDPEPDPEPKQDPQLMPRTNWRIISPGEF